MSVQSQTTTVLGLDLGANSIGWALIEHEGDEARRILGAGVRVFSIAAEGDFESGKDESPNASRRNARQIRRQLERRARRIEKHAGVLQRFGLLPEGNVSDPQQRHEFFLALDGQLKATYAGEASDTFHHVFPYWLRARALDHQLDPHALGRALYHLGQRRGFLSNRKAAAKEKDDEKSKVKQGISELAKEIEASGARTLGEYFAGLDPTDAQQRRIRQRWTARRMYQTEFEAIWSAQATHHPELLTRESHDAIYDVIFHQRPMKLQKHLIGTCQFEYRGKNPRKRAPMALPIAQRFRMLQKVNDLRIVDSCFRESELSAEQRAAVLGHLDLHAEVKFTALRNKVLKLAKGLTFNLERGGEERLIGNRTAAKLIEIFGEARWLGMSVEEQERVIDDLRSFQNDDALARRGVRHYGLEPETAGRFGALELEPGYCGLSRQALGKLVPLMEQGISYATAAKQVYGDLDDAAPTELLPSVSDAICQRLIPELRNPVVNRVLSELGKVINALIKKFGKPDCIRIELARDLKKTRDQRKNISIKNRKNEKGRKGAAAKVAEITGDSHPSRDAIERLLLHEECGGLCPYTGKPISERNLLSGQSQFDVEHIIPFSRSLDNSYLNKTLCYHEENRTHKHSKTPAEAYSGERYEEILARVRKFSGDARDEKLRRFLLTDLEEFDDFSKRMLNDTRYATTLAVKYLGILYGSEWRKHIQAATGQVTAHLRDVWKLNKILGDGGTKSRDDHRHHAVDAIAIALTSPSTVKMLNLAASRADAEGRRRFGNVAPPWDCFLEDVQSTIDGVIVSHRVSRKVNGCLHEQTHYGPQPSLEDGKPRVHVRKPIDALSAADLKEGVIVDPVVRKRILDKLDELGSGDPKKAFLDPKNHPCIETKDGRQIPIHKVRIARVLTTFRVASGVRQRHVSSDSNHHMEVFQVKDDKGGVTWKDVIISRFDAVRRLKEGGPVVSRAKRANQEFLFSLSVRDMVSVDDESGRPALWLVASIWEDRMSLRRPNDARKGKDDALWSPRLNTLRKQNCRKLAVTPLGEVRRAND